MSRLNIFTIVLQGQPWITNHLPVFNRLRVPWTWVVIEGVARNVGSTKWCQKLSPGLSNDGTTEYMRSIESHPNVRYISRLEWEGGKDQMTNRCLDEFKEPGLLLQVDSDELWTADQLEIIVKAFEANPQIYWMMFPCIYMLGHNIRIVTDGTYGNRNGEWLRAWRYQPGMRFTSHEPPILSGAEVRFMSGFSREQTRQMQLTFSHYAYATEQQVAFKEQFYHYPGAVEQWRRLQANTVWPARVGDYLKWVKDDAMCDLLWKP